MATQVMTNHHHVTFSGSNQAFGQHSPPGPGPTTSYSANGIVNGYANGSAALAVVEHDNPFRPGSELIEDAENILKNVTIVGSQVIVANNDSGIVASSPTRQVERSPIDVSRTNELHCSTILSTTTSTPGPAVKEEQCVVVRASPESLRPESPPLRAEHVVITSNGGVKASPSKGDTSQPAAASPAVPTTSTATAATSEENNNSASKKGKKKPKKKCTII